MTERRDDYEAPQVADLGRLEDLTLSGQGGIKETGGGTPGGGQATFSRAV